LEGLKAAMSTNKKACVDVYPTSVGVSFSEGRRGIAELAAKSCLPKALFFINDALAAGALLECVVQRVLIPQDLAVVGSADLEIAAAMQPSLSNVRVLSRQIGETAA
jgi:DNA-binding LacI/PurR family transcriptional regulator